MGGYSKGHGGITTHNSSSSRRRGVRSYGLMLIIAFGAAILGVMTLHKLRERRIFNLLVKEKDRQLFSLQLLLQKERDYAKETKRETKEMKSKLYSLQAQKTDLNSRILELQSTISSLKDEQKAMETALEEKQNELKFLREKEIDLNRESPQLTSLSNNLKQKEAEIEDLKNQHSSPVKVWSVSTDDPSNPPMNLTLAQNHETEVTENAERSGNNSIRKGIGNGKQSMNDGEEEEPLKLEVSKEGSGNGNERNGDDGKGGLGIGKEENKETGTEGILKTGVEVQNPRDEDSNVKVIDSKERGVNNKGGVKLEMPEQTENGASYKLGGNRANKRKGKGKRLKVISNKGDLKEDEVVSVRGRKFFKDALESERKKRIQVGEVQKIEHEDRNMGLNARNESKEDGKASVSDELQQMVRLESITDDRNAKENSSAMESMRIGEQGEESEMQSKNVSTYVTLQKGGKDKDSEKMSEKVENGKKMDDDILQIRGKTEDGENVSKEVKKGKEREIENVPFEKPSDFPGLLPLNRTVNGEGKQKPGEVGIREENVDNDAKQGKGADKYEETEELEVEDIKESDKDISRESKSQFEDSKEDREETAEPDLT
ncbi:hypothetical protein LguiA_022597 [Lonicera macranthoides]